MKKLLLIILLIVGCSQTPSIYPYYQDKYGDLNLEGLPLEEIKNAKKPSPIEEAQTHWSIGFYVDRFDEPTGEKYVWGHTNGVFSNSATTNSDLYVTFIIDKKNVSIKLYEYGRNHPVKSGGSYDVIYKQNDNKHYGSGFLGSDQLKLDRKDGMEVVKMFIKGDEVQFYIDEFMGHSQSEYKFTINPTFFDYYFNQLLIEENERN